MLVIENADVLKQVCLHAGISDRWLCVWGNWSVQDGIIAFLKLMNDNAGARVTMASGPSASRQHITA